MMKPADQDTNADAFAALVQVTKRLGEKLVETGAANPVRIQWQLTKASRQEMAKQLEAQGMTRRAIAKQLGVSHETINQDLGGKKLAKNGKKSSTPKNGNGHDRDEPESTDEGDGEMTPNNRRVAVLLQITSAYDLMTAARNRINLKTEDYRKKDLREFAEEAARTASAWSDLARELEGKVTQ